MLARLADLPRGHAALGVRGQVGRRARDRLLRARAPAVGGAQRQRHHDALSRAAPAQPRAELAQRDPRRRGRRVRRARAVRASGASSAGCTSPPRRRAKRLSKESPVAYVIFDLLWLDGHSVMGLPYAERRELLEAPRAEGPELAGARLRRRATARDLLAATRAQGLEGDRRQAPGQPVRAGAAHRRAGARSRTSSAQDSSSAAGCRARARREQRIGALLVGGATRRTATLRYAGRVGTGFTEASSTASPALLAPLVRDEVAVDRRRRSRRRGAVFVEPRHVAEVEFIEWTRMACFVHPPTRACARMSPCHPQPSSTPGGPSAAGREVTVEDRVLRVTNLDKVLYPEVGFTKRDVIEYSSRIAPVLLPHLERPAADAQALPQRRRGAVLLREELADAPARLGRDRDGADRTARRSTSRSRRTSPTLVWLGNLADLELHTSLVAGADDDRAPDDAGLRPRPGPAGRRSWSAAASRCGCRGCSRASG